MCHNTDELSVLHGPVVHQVLHVETLSGRTGERATSATQVCIVPLQLK